jgi:uncharacterized membrane protein YfcA
MLIAVLVALGAVWGGLFVSWYPPQYPVSFYIVTIVFGTYVLLRVGLGVREFSRARRRAPVPPPTVSVAGSSPP